MPHPVPALLTSLVALGCQTNFVNKRTHVQEPIAAPAVDVPPSVLARVAGRICSNDWSEKVIADRDRFLENLGLHCHDAVSEITHLALDDDTSSVAPWHLSPIVTSIYLDDSPGFSFQDLAAMSALKNLEVESEHPDVFVRLASADTPAADVEVDVEFDAPVLPPPRPLMAVTRLEFTGQVSPGIAAKDFPRLAEIEILHPAGPTAIATALAFPIRDLEINLGAQGDDLNALAAMAEIPDIRVIAEYENGQPQEIALGAAIPLVDELHITGTFPKIANPEHLTRLYNLTFDLTDGEVGTHTLFYAPNVTIIGAPSRPSIVNLAPGAYKTIYLDDKAGLTALVVAPGTSVLKFSADGFRPGRAGEVLGAFESLETVSLNTVSAEALLTLLARPEPISRLESDVIAPDPKLAAICGAADLQLHPWISEICRPFGAEQDSHPPTPTDEMSDDREKP